MPEESAKAPTTATPPVSRSLDQGKRHFIIAPRRGSQALSAGLRPMSAPAVRAVLSQLPGLEIVRVLRPRRAVSALSLTPDESTEVFVARVEPDRAQLVKQMASAHLLVEEDAALEYATPAGVAHPGPSRLASWNTTTGVETRQIRLRVIGEGDKGLANAGVSLAGEGFPQEGRTDKRGEATLPLVALPGRRARSLFVSAPHGYWDTYLVDPELSETDVNVVRLRAIEETIAGFPDQFRFGWGQLLMGLDRLPDTITGRGVKIAIVDSGADTSHPLLRHIRLGVDLTNQADPQTWTLDIVGHGTHAAGIIAARDDSGKLMRGFAPEAEIHVLKVFPGAQFSTLIEALDYCIERDIDVVNLSLGGPHRSQAIDQKLEEVARSGIACIVAAGSSTGPVQYPASSPYTFAVGAVGRVNEYPEATWDATTVTPGLVAADGIFSPTFTCFGPEVAVCAPGVAVVSTVPGGYEPQSGTSVAAPHVTGLAALLLAHHPVFQGALRGRTQQRVAALFAMIRAMAVPYGFGPERAGAGVPRLHGLELLLQPPASAGGLASGSGRNDAGYATAGAGMALGGIAGPIGAGFGVPVFAPQETGGVTTLIDPGQVNPLYVQASLVAQAWPVQALLESLRRQYLGG